MPTQNGQNQAVKFSFESQQQRAGRQGALRLTAASIISYAQSLDMARAACAASLHQFFLLYHAVRNCLEAEEAAPSVGARQTPAFLSKTDRKSASQGSR